jgi:hypothetical protein
MLERAERAKRLTDAGNAPNPDDDLAMMNSDGEDPALLPGDDFVPVAVPVKYTSRHVRLRLACRVHLLPLDGRSDSVGTRHVLHHAQPLKLVLLHTPPELVQSLVADAEAHISPEVYAPPPGDEIDLTSATNVYMLRIHEEILRNLAFTSLTAGHSAAWVEGWVEGAGDNSGSGDAGSGSKGIGSKGSKDGKHSSSRSGRSGAGGGSGKDGAEDGSSGARGGRRGRGSGMPGGVIMAGSKLDGGRGGRGVGGRGDDADTEHGGGGGTSGGGGGASSEGGMVLVGGASSGARTGEVMVGELRMVDVRSLVEKAGVAGARVEAGAVVCPGGTAVSRIKGARGAGKRKVVIEGTFGEEIFKVRKGVLSGVNVF